MAVPCSHTHPPTHAALGCRCVGGGQHGWRWCSATNKATACMLTNCREADGWWSRLVEAAAICRQSPSPQAVCLSHPWESGTDSPWKWKAATWVAMAAASSTRYAVGAQDTKAGHHMPSPPSSSGPLRPDTVCSMRRSGSQGRGPTHCTRCSCSCQLGPAALCSQPYTLELCTSGRMVGRSQQTISIASAPTDRSTKAGGFSQCGHCQGGAHHTP